MPDFSYPHVCVSMRTQSKVVGCIGGVALLRAVGFVKVDDDTGGKLVLSLEAIDQKLLGQAQEELTKAVASYVGY